MINGYIQTALRQAQYEQMKDGEWFASIPGFNGLWATGTSGEEVRQQLAETLNEWILVHISIGGNKIPAIGELSNIEKIESATR